MSTRTLIRVAAVVGGLCLLAQAAVNQYDAAEAAVNALYWGGIALVLVALVGLGAELVSGALALKLLVGACFPLLVWAVISVLHKQTSDNLVDGGFGLGLALICSASLLGGPAKDDQGLPRRQPQQPPVGGTALPAGIGPDTRVLGLGTTTGRKARHG